jgi:hypothetical protein
MSKKKKIPSIVKDIQKSIMHEVNYAYEKSISYSQLSMYTECPKKWSLQYKEGHKQFTSSIHTVFGTALHETLQTYITTMYEKSGAEADRLNTSEMLEENLREEYKVQYKKNNNQHFLEPSELREFYEDGIEIIREFAKHRGKYFSKRGWYLVGCEIPIMLKPSYNHPNLYFQGFLDVVMYNETTNRFLIIDIKTSKSGWFKEQKQDELKQFQLILYKKFFSEQYGIPIDTIDIEFFIVKRKLYESEDFIIRRVQQFKPPAGKIKLNKATQTLNKFITEAFDKEGYKDVEHQPTPNKNCGWCQFYKTHLCSATY